MRLLFILVSGMLTGCASQKIELENYGLTYSQPKHIVDNRQYGEQAFTEGDKVLKNLNSLAKIASAGPYAAGTVELDKEFLPISPNMFTIPPLLALDMAIENHLNSNNKELAAFTLTGFSIQSQYIFLDLPGLSKSSKCNIYADYRGAKLWSTSTATSGSSNFEQQIESMVKKCISGILDRIDYHDERVSNQ